MKKLIYGISFLAIIGITIIGCKKENFNPTSNTSSNNTTIDKDNLDNESKYAELESLINNDLNQIAQELRSKKSNFNSQSDVTSAAESLYSNNNEILTSFISNYSNTINHQNTKNGYSDNVTNVINEIEINLNNSTDPLSFITFLETKFNEIEASNLKDDEKDLLLQYIVIYKASITFMGNNQDLISTDQKAGWWSSWGKCAASIVGGAAIGGLGGAAAGSVVPGIGTVAGGIVGVIGGGLSGAGAGC